MAQLFFLDTNIAKLSLSEDAFVYSNGMPLVVRVQFLDFPMIEITECTRRIQEGKYFYVFEAGHTRHFCMTFEELIQKFKKFSLKIGVYREGDSFPVCELCTRLAGCICSMIASSIKKAEPVVFNGPFHLVNPGKDPAGLLGGEFTLINMGDQVRSYFILQRGYVSFRSSLYGDTYMCYYADNPTECPVEVSEKELPLENYVLKIANFSPLAPCMARGRPSVVPSIVIETPVKGKKEKKR